jgi:hypothetical protein
LLEGSGYNCLIFIKNKETIHYRLTFSVISVDRLNVAGSDINRDIESFAPLFNGGF